MKNNKDISHYSKILCFSEEKVKYYLKHQVKNQGSQDYGSFYDPELGLSNPGEATNGLMMLISLYLNKDSSYYCDKSLINSIDLALDYLERVQRVDGTIDLVTTNFFSGPDTGFALHSLAISYKLLDKLGNNETPDQWKKKFFQLIKKTGYGIINGGFHTPNHRWVNAAALMMAYSIVQKDEFKEIACRYLAEGIDCDQNGEYTERSSGIYNATNNDSLIKIAEETGRCELLEFVERNLNMMFYYLEPDGTVFTGNSLRQDKGEAKKFYPLPYYHLYLYMAWKKGYGQYMKMANYIIENVEKWGIAPDKNLLARYLYIFMLNPELRNLKGLSEAALPVNYDKFFEKSGVVRVRKGDYSYTILQENSSFLFFQLGELRLNLKIAASFFSVAQFKAEELQKTEDGYSMSFTAQGSYKLPFENPPVTSDWWEMDHSQRDVVNHLELKIIIRLTNLTEGIKLQVMTEGCDRVPFKVEFAVTPRSVIEGESFILEGQAGDSLVAKKGKLIIKKGLDSVEIGPAFGKHNFATRMRGSEPASNQHYTIYFTDFTNLDREIIIKKFEE